MSERSMRRWLSSPPPTPAAARLPDDDDLLQEILPPLPSSLLRVGLVCKRWRRLLSDPHFLRHFRALHHREPPLLGFFTGGVDVSFTPTLDAPDRIPTRRFYLPMRPEVGEVCWYFFGCRHGLALIFNPMSLEVTVWDPVTGDQRCVALPPGFDQNDQRLAVRGGALLCCSGQASEVPIESFKVIILWTDDVLLHADPHAFASLYHSETVVWDNPILTSIRSALCFKPNILVGNSLYWFLLGYHQDSGILEFDLDKNSLTKIDTPMSAHVTRYSQILRMEDSRLGLAVLSDLFFRKKGSTPDFIESPNRFVRSQHPTMGEGQLQRWCWMDASENHRTGQAPPAETIELFAWIKDQ